MDEIKQSFVVESREQNERMKDILSRISINRSIENPETNKAIFINVHNIYSAALRAKYAAGSFEYEVVIEFMHDMDNVLDGICIGTINFSQSLVELLLACSDHLATLIDCVELNKELDKNLNSQLLRDRLQSYLGNAIDESKAPLLAILK